MITLVILPLVTWSIEILPKSLPTASKDTSSPSEYNEPPKDISMSDKIPKIVNLISRSFTVEMPLIISPSSNVPTILLRYNLLLSPTSRISWTSPAAAPAVVVAVRTEP